jgi:hypothetical protein
MLNFLCNKKTIGPELLTSWMLFSHFEAQVELIFQIF